MHPEYLIFYNERGPTTLKETRGRAGERNRKEQEKIQEVKKESRLDRRRRGSDKEEERKSLQ